MILACIIGVCSQTPTAERSATGYIGFDRNDYPGDANLETMRQTFSYSGYWLNNPPGAERNSWVGRRKTLQSAGFGFLILFNGRTYAKIKSAGDAAKLGRSDAAAAAKAARAEGFPPDSIIFLDQEQGGRLLPSNDPIFYPGSTESPTRTLAQACIAQASQRKRILAFQW